jgi:hypothetical protein
MGNSSFEGAYYKGHSPTRHLSEIAIRVHKVERDGGFILHVIHISGKLMKALGVDGLSCRDLMEGMMDRRDPCGKCGKIRQAGHGLFCSNFLLGRAVGHGIGGIDIPAKMVRLAKSLSQE